MPKKPVINTIRMRVDGVRALPGCRAGGCPDARLRRSAALPGREKRCMTRGAWIARMHGKDDCARYARVACARMVEADVSQRPCAPVPRVHGWSGGSDAPKLLRFLGLALWRFTGLKQRISRFRAKPVEVLAAGRAPQSQAEPKRTLLPHSFKYSGNSGNDFRSTPSYLRSTRYA